MGTGASSALGPPRPLPRGRGGLLRSGTTKAPAAWGWGPPSFCDHGGPRCMGEGASSVFGTTEAPAAWARGPPPPARWSLKPSPVSIQVPQLAAFLAQWLSLHTRAQVRSRWEWHLGRVCCGPRTDTSGRSAVRPGGGLGYGPSPRELPAKRRLVGSTLWAKGPHP